MSNMKHIPISRMLAFIGVTFTLFLGLAFFSAYMKREEIMANWSKYKSDPMYMFTSPMFKPDDDPRSRTKFAMDNFFDVIQGMVTNVFSVFLQPVFKIFQLFTDAVVQSLSGLFNIRMLLGNMWKKWNEASDVFVRRFNSVFHQLRVTFIKLYSAMEKSFASSISSIYMGLSTINTVLSFIDLMFKVILIILAILVIMMIFLFFILWPIMPLIIAAVSVLVVAGVGAASGMSGTFCFAGDTPIMTPSGNVPISEVRINQELHGGATVKGIMAFDTNVDDLYELWGIKVSGTHIVYDEDGMPIHVQNHPDATKLPSATMKLYCLITSDQKIPVDSNIGPVVFADWEELSDDESLRRWHKEVFETLNPGATYIVPMKAAIDSESVVSPRTHIATSLGPAEIRGIKPGDLVLDADGKQTRVIGVVCIADVKAAVKLGENAYASAGAWIKTTGGWNQPIDTVGHEEDRWYSLFTESGTFRLYEDSLPAMRDFTDVGPTKIGDTYEWVLDALKSSDKEHVVQ